MSKVKSWSTDDPGPLGERVLGELEAANVQPDRPLIAVDADEVLVHFAEHFKVFCEARGNTFQLTEYSLDSALRGPDGRALTRDEIGPLIWAFIDAETRTQPPVEGAAAGLAALAEVAQIVVLTNAPSKVREDRIANLAELGMPYPVVMNEGGKGRALDWLSKRAAAPVAFIDDSAAQHGSAAKHAPQVMRFHLVGSEMLKPILGHVETAQAHPEDWPAAVPMIRAALASGI